MSTCDKRYKTAAGQGGYGRYFNPGAMTRGVQHAAYATRGNPSQIGSPQGMNPGVGPYSNQASRYVTRADGMEVEVPMTPGCSPVALAPAPLQECATECVKKVQCFCAGSYLLSEKGKMY